MKKNLRQSEFKYTQNKKNESITLYLNRAQFTEKYHVSVSELGRVRRTPSEKYPDASEWGIHMYAKHIVTREWMREFHKVIQELVPDNTINWDSTERYYDAQDEQEEE